MPILALFSCNMTVEQYENLRREVGWEQEPPTEAVFHSAGFDESGHLHVADVWTSPEAMAEFVEQRLKPAFEKLGIPPLGLAVYPLHNLHAYRRSENYRLG